MEQRQDYMENQVSLLSRLLKRLLEKLLKKKSDDAGVLSEPITVCQTADTLEELTIQDLQTIENSLLISVLTEKYRYNENNVQMLADILYELTMHNPENNEWMRQKAMVLYEYYLANAKNVIQLSAFLRLQKLQQ